MDDMHVNSLFYQNELCEVLYAKEESPRERGGRKEGP